MKFVESIIIYAYLQAVGVINSHKSIRFLNRKHSITTPYKTSRPETLGCLFYKWVVIGSKTGPFYGLERLSFEALYQ